jgi:hypothetical protein
MPGKKNQHFVPKLYLKFFSCEGDNNTIGIYNLENDILILRGALKPQAKEDYFYGEDGYLEEQLSKLEDIAAPVLRRVLAETTLPARSSQDYFNLFAFTMILANRTKDVAEQIKEMSDKMIREIMRQDERFKDNIDDYRIYPKNPAALALTSTAERLPLAMDLRAKLLLNKTTTKFITSDNPVVKYNQFLEERKHPGGNVGLFTKGLQIFFPLSPILMLHLYDDWVYKVGGKSREVVELSNSSDIDKLNSLQILNCYDHLYFNHEINERYIRLLVKDYKAKRLEEYSDLKKSHSYTDKKGQEHIFYHSHGHNIEINLLLSFITQTKKAKQHILNNYAVQLRREELRHQLRSDRSEYEL